MVDSDQIPRSGASDLGLDSLFNAHRNHVKSKVFEKVQYLRWPKWLTFHFHTTSQFRIPNSEFRIPKFALRISEFGMRNCEVYVVWASGNS